MVNTPVRFNRVAAAFEEVAKHSCQSSGSEHSADLSDLLYSFHESETSDPRINIGNDDGDDDDDDETRRNSQDLELVDSLKNVFGHANDNVKSRIRKEIGKVLPEVKRLSPSDYKRGLMARLRDKGFDAGLCKSKWEKSSRCASGDYEYIDINANGSRYIIEVSLVGEFTIARPTNFYASLLDLFPPIFVGKPDEVKEVVRLMSNAIRNSMMSAHIHMPPWRREAYLQAKWFGSYKRTTNYISSCKASGSICAHLENMSIG